MRSSVSVFSFQCPLIKTHRKTLTKKGTDVNSLCQFIGAGHGDQRTSWSAAAAVLMAACCDWQRPLASVHLHPEVAVELPAGT